MSKLDATTNQKKRMTLTIAEAAEILGIGRNQAYEAARNDQIPSIRIGKRFLVPVAALEKFLGCEIDHNTANKRKRERLLERKATIEAELEKLNGAGS